MGLFTAIGSIVSTVGSVISGAASCIGTKISGFALNSFKVIARLSKVNTDVGRLISIAAKIIHSVTDFLGIQSEENPETLGAKVEQTDKNLEDFGNDVEAYIKYLKTKVQLDKDKFNKMTLEEKMGCKTIGMALETKAIEQKIGGIEITPECIATLTKIKDSGINIDAKELVGIVQILKESGITNLSDIVEFLEGKGTSDRLKTYKIFSTALGDNGTKKILDLQDAVRKYEKD